MTTRRLPAPPALAMPLRHPDGRRALLRRENDLFVEQVEAPGLATDTRRELMGAHAAAVLFELRLSDLREAGFEFDSASLGADCTPARAPDGALKALTEALAADCPTVATLLDTHTRWFLNDTPRNRIAAAEARVPWVEVREYDHDGDLLEYYSCHLYHHNWPGTKPGAAHDSFVDFFNSATTALSHNGGIYVWCEDEDSVGLVDVTLTRCTPWLHLWNRKWSNQEELNVGAAHELRAFVLSICEPSTVSVRLKVHGDIEPFETVLEDTHARHLVTHLVLRADNPTRRHGPPTALGGRFPSLQALSCNSVALPSLLTESTAPLESLVVETWPGPDGVPTVLSVLDRPALASLRHLGLWNAHLEPADFETLARHHRVAQLTSLDLARASNGDAWGDSLLRWRPHLSHLRWLLVPESVAERFPQEVLDSWPELIPCRYGYPESVAIDIATYGWPPYEW
jgi:hypothetical protein